MRLKLLCSGAALALALVVSDVVPAAADTSSCTHNWSGPQVCIRMNGRNGWNSVTAIWVNPPHGVKRRRVQLTLDGARLGASQVARRVGRTISYTWSGFEQDTGVKVCVQFADIDRVACDETKYVGSRPSL